MNWTHESNFPPSRNPYKNHNKGMDGWIDKVFKGIYPRVNGDNTTAQTLGRQESRQMNVNQGAL